MEFPPAPRRPRPNLNLNINPGPSPPLSARPISLIEGDDEADINSELAKLESLRMNVRQNLTLRPLKSPSPSNAGTLTLNSAGSSRPSPPPSAVRRTFRPVQPDMRSGSNGSTACTDSSYETASTRTDTTTPTSPSSGNSSPVMYTAISPNGPRGFPPLHSPSDIISHYTSGDSESPPLSPSHRSSLPSAPALSTHSHAAKPLSSSDFLKLIASAPPTRSRPLLLDTRPVGPYLTEHLEGSINLSVPPLFLKRWKKYLDKEKGGQQALAQAVGDSIKGLRGFITTEEGKEEWDRFIGSDPQSSSGTWNGDIVVYDEDMDETDPLAPRQSQPKSSSKPSSQPSLQGTSPTTSWLIIRVLLALSPPASGHQSGIYWLKGGYAAARADPSLGAKHLIHVGDGDRNATGHQLIGGSATVGVSDLAIESPRIKAVYTSSPTDLEQSPLPLSDSSQSTRSSGTDQAAAGKPSIPKAAASPANSGSGSAIGPGTVGGGLFTLKTDGPASSSRTKGRPHLEIAPITSPVGASVSSGAGANSVPDSHEPGVLTLAPPRSQLNHTQSMLSLVSPVAATLDLPQKANLALQSPGPGSTSFQYPMLYDASPSPSPSTTTANLPFPRTSTATSGMRSRSNTAMLPKLARLDTKSRERLVPPINTNVGSNPSKPIPPLPTNANSESKSDNASGMPPKLHLRTALKAATLAAPIASPKVGTFGPKPVSSPVRSGFNVTSPSMEIMTPMSGTSIFYTPVQTPSEFPSQYPYTPADSSYHNTYQYATYGNPPRSPALPSTPLTARPPLSPISASALTSESEPAIPPFIVSTILPGFLYLGPEMSSDEHAEEVESLGVKRVLNMAMECEPEDYGLDLSRRFERYMKVPMRDTVEEDRVAKGLKEVCEFLDDARLHSSPTYVHCKAGKSRSVTAVMAYLIHANHWPLSRAYAFVNERRKGVSPNIGFVSELMNFEELKLGTKSVGVNPDSTSSHPPPNNGGGAGAGQRRAAHARDSLPPALHHTQSMGEAMSHIGAPVSAGIVSNGLPGVGAAEEMEVKDEEGRYRHARRRPVDENTLQPLRRVSKAGLESSWI
ncbi:hypothetical protein FRB99_000086 [Tulasnella sp. 403]|nr:hypothetical protein FRB99_000086 [Tulasnella sp. 403]